MRTTIDIPDELFRRAKVEAAMSGRTLKDIVEEGLRLMLDKDRNDAPAPEASAKDRKPRPGSLHEAAQKYCGIISDGPADLATNPKYFEGFGR